MKRIVGLAIIAAAVLVMVASLSTSVAAQLECPDDLQTQLENPEVGAAPDIDECVWPTNDDIGDYCTPEGAPCP